MWSETIAARVLIIAGTLAACLVIGFIAGSHVRRLSDAHAYTALQQSQAKALLIATEASRDAQAQADAAQLAQQAAAIDAANAAASRHSADLDAANASIASLRAKLNATASRQPAVKTWLSTPVPYGVFKDACKYADSRTAGC